MVKEEEKEIEGEYIMTSVPTIQINCGGRGNMDGTRMLPIYQNYGMKTMMSGIDVSGSSRIPYDFTPMDLPEFKGFDTGHKWKCTENAIKNCPRFIIKYVHECIRKYRKIYNEDPRVILIKCSAHGGTGWFTALSIAAALKGLRPDIAVILSVVVGNPWESVLKENASYAISFLKNTEYADVARIIDSNMMIKCSTITSFEDELKLISTREAYVNCMLFTSIVSEMDAKSQTEDIVNTYKSMNTRFSSIQIEETELSQKSLGITRIFSDTFYRVRENIPLACTWPKLNGYPMQLGIGIKAPAKKIDNSTINTVINSIQQEKRIKLNGFTSLSEIDKDKMVIAAEFEVQLTDAFYEMNGLVKNLEVDTKTLDNVYNIAKGWGGLSD